MIGKSRQDESEVVQVILTENEKEPEIQHNRYSIPPLDLLHSEELAEKLNLAIIGYFHSHPNHQPNPSLTDLENAWPGYSYLIVSVFNGQAANFRSWRLRNDRSDFDPEQVHLAQA